MLSKPAQTISYFLPVVLVFTDPRWLTCGRVFTLSLQIEIYDCIIYNRREFRQLYLLPTEGILSRNHLRAQLTIF